jgi:hypothetical protein
MPKWDVILKKAIDVGERFNDISERFSTPDAPVRPDQGGLKLDVVEILPDRDNKNDIYLLSGTTENLNAQIPLFLAIEELVSVRTGNFNLKAWAENFCNEFPNYPGKGRPKDFLQKPWGVEQSNKPRLDILQGTGKAPDPYYVCQYFPDRTKDEEFYWASGNASQVINQVMQIVNFNKMIAAKDLGEFYGYPIDEYYRVKPSKNTSIKLFFTNRKQPPYYKGSSTTFFFKGQVSICNVDETKLTYENIRAICNASNGLVWGHWQARAYVTSHEDYAPIQQIVAGGDDKPTAQANLEKFLTLTKSKVVSKSTTNLEGNTQLAQDDPWWKEKSKFEIYPHFMTVVNRVKAPVSKNKPGRATAGGSLKYKKKRLFINSQTEPVGWSQALRQVLANTVK